MSLRSYVEILFKQVVEDISDQFNRTNETFRTRMEEIRYTKMKLEGLHCGTANQVREILEITHKGHSNLRFFLCKMISKCQKPLVAEYFFNQSLCPDEFSTFQSNSRER